MIIINLSEQLKQWRIDRPDQRRAWNEDQRQAFKKISGCIV
jgi:hypothetical protein